MTARVGPLWNGTLDFEGRGSRQRSIAERANLLESEAAFPVSPVLRETQPYALEKLRDIRSYLWAYSVILNKHARGNFAVVDGFAGPGVVDLRGSLQRGQRRLDSRPMASDLALGSPLLMLSNRPHFPKVYLLEKDPATFEALRARVEAYYPARAVVELADANIRLPMLAAALAEGRTPTLFVLDPEGLELSMQTLRDVITACPKAEVLLLYPSYMAVARCYHKESAWPALDKFFGDDTNVDPHANWRLEEEFSKALIEKDDYLPNAIHERLFRYYQNKLKAAGFQVVIPSSVIKTDKGRPLYHLLFAGNNETGGKIMREIFEPHREPPPR